jgi:hypothetical protein
VEVWNKRKHHSSFVMYDASLIIIMHHSSSSCITHHHPASFTMHHSRQGTSEAQAEAQLEAVLGLFRHLEDKDVFEAFYKKHLARRLLLGRSASYDLERVMLAKVRPSLRFAVTSVTMLLYTPTIITSTLPH